MLGARASLIWTLVFAGSCLLLSDCGLLLLRDVEGASRVNITKDDELSLRVALADESSNQINQDEDFNEEQEEKEDEDEDDEDEQVEPELEFGNEQPEASESSESAAEFEADSGGTDTADSSGSLEQPDDQAVKVRGALENPSGSIGSDINGANSETDDRGRSEEQKQSEFGGSSWAELDNIEESKGEYDPSWAYYANEVFSLPCVEMRAKEGALLARSSGKLYENSRLK